MEKIFFEHVGPSHPSFHEHLKWLTEIYFSAVEEEFSHSPIKAYRTTDASRSNEVRAMLQTLIMDQERSFLLLARNKDGNVGYFLGLIKECLGENPSAVGYVNGMYVIPSQRRQGIAQDLLERGLFWFKKKGIQLVELYIAINNQSGRGFWKKNGYLSYEEVLFKKI